MNTATNPIANSVIVLREEFDDWAILFDPDTGSAVGINPVGVAIWKLLDGIASLETITRHITTRFADVPATVEQEIAAFVADLVARGMVGYEGEP